MFPNAVGTVGSFSGDPTGAGAIFAADGVETGTGAVVAKLNSLLRGEISAAETYRNVLTHISTGTHADSTEFLRSIQLEHARSCQTLRDRIRELGGEPTDDSGIWGIWAQTVQGTLQLFGGDAGGLRALREGEDHGLKDYQDALNEVDATSAMLITNQLLPAQTRHLTVLDQLIAKVSAE
jgi:uncharacterized protein (TIGR02284 family)